MGALPKNKITRRERGKRRWGNTPKVTKNVKQSKVPMHKQSLVAQMFKALGFSK